MGHVMLNHLIFSAVGIGDLVFATLKAVGAAMHTFAMGWNWYILNLYVPMLVVGHVMMLRLLMRATVTSAPLDTVASRPDRR